MSEKGLPELFFVYDPEERDFVTFLTEPEAIAAYDKLIERINKEAETNGEFEGDELVFRGKVTHRAEVVPVAVDERTDEEVFGMCSYPLGGA